MIAINNVDCGLSLKGTGIDQCSQTLGKPVGFWDLPLNLSLDINADTFDRAAVINKIKEGTLHVFNNAVDFAENNEEDVTQTFSSGIITDVRDGLPAFDFMYINGYAWHSAAYSHNSFGGNIALLYQNGVIGLASSLDGKRLEGLTRGRLKTATFKNNTGSEVSMTMISLQLTDTIQYNTRIALINDTSFGSSPLNIGGAVNANVKVIGTPAVGDTTTVVSVAASANASRFAAGLLFSDFNYSGQNVTAAVYDAATGQYTLTHDALVAGVKVISLGEGTDFAAQVGTTELLYTGSSLQFTV